MDIAVKDAARRLELSESRIRQLLAAGDLRGRRLGRTWLVDGDDVARLRERQRRPGRPAGPKRAWAILDLLGGGSAPWLSYSERSQVRSYTSALRQPSADEWLGTLRGRSELRPVRAHPAALSRFVQFDHVLPTGSAEAIRRGFDLVSTHASRPEVYLPRDAWDVASRALVLQPSHDGDLVIHHPVALWPFGNRDSVPDAVVAADLLQSSDPRVVRAGRERLNELLHDLQEASGG